MSGQNREVPYKSQWDNDAQGTRNDCGPCSVAMILNYYGENLTTDQIFQRTGAGQGLITINQLQKAISSFGYTSNYEKNVTTARIKELIDKDTPPIVLVHYGDLNSRQDKKFAGGHIMPVVGYYDDGYYANDPDFSGNVRSDGDHHNYLKAELEKSWNNASLDGNSPNSLIWIPRKQPTVDTDEQNAVMLLRQFKDSTPELQHGNLEGTMRSLLDSRMQVVNLQAQIAQLAKERDTVKGAISAFLAAIGVKQAS